VSLDFSSQFISLFINQSYRRGWMSTTILQSSEVGPPSDMFTATVV